tara:strand:+ start:554 stop:1072 length:519 start_codon:yes stop_codon:yes gene_type:complete
MKMSEAGLNDELAVLAAEIETEVKSNSPGAVPGRNENNLNENSHLKGSDFQKVELNEIEASKIAQSPPQDQMWAGLWGLTGMVLSGRYGAHWVIDDGECRELGKVTDQFMDKYFPETDVGIEFAMISTAAAVFAPKFIIHQQIVAQQDAQPETSSSQPSDQGEMLKGVDDGQ